jgi:hypothetical protein
MEKGTGLSLALHIAAHTEVASGRTLIIAIAGVFDWILGQSVHSMPVSANRGRDLG